MNLVYTTHQKTIELGSYNDTVTIWFFGDIHRDTSSCDVDRWQRFLKSSDGENTFYFGMGDYTDFASTSEKKKLIGQLHEPTEETLDLIAETNNRVLAKEMGVMKGKLLGLIEGNHTWFMKNGQTSTEDLATRMGCDYLGWLCHYTIIFNYKNRPGAARAFHIVACHGKAGGKSYGNTVNQVADLKAIFPVADIYCEGHDHQRWADPISVLVPVKGQNGFKIKQKEQLLCRSGSFKKSYEPDKGGYEAAKLLKPANLGALKVIVQFIRDQKDGEDNINIELSAMV